MLVSSLILHSSDYSPSPCYTISNNLGTITRYYMNILTVSSRVQHQNSCISTTTGLPLKHYHRLYKLHRIHLWNPERGCRNTLLILSTSLSTASSKQERKRIRQPCPATPARTNIGEEGDWKNSYLRQASGKVHQLISPSFEVDHMEQSAHQPKWWVLYWYSIVTLSS